MTDWQAIKTEYITTDTSYRKLAQKYGVNHTVIGHRAKAEKWVDLRRQYIDKTQAKTLEKISRQEAARAAKVLNTADKLLNKIDALADGTKELDAKSIRLLTAAVKDLKETLGIKSDLDKQEQEARIENLRSRADRQTDSDGVIEVVFAAGPEEWNE